MPKAAEPWGAAVLHGANGLVGRDSRTFEKGKIAPVGECQTNFGIPSGHLYDFQTVERKGRWIFVPDAIFPKPCGFCLADKVLAKFYEWGLTAACAAQRAKTTLYLIDTT